MISKETSVLCDHCEGVGQVPTPATIRARRKEAGLTLAAVAEKVGISLSYLHNFETNSRHLSWTMEARILNAIDALEQEKQT